MTPTVPVPEVLTAVKVKVSPSTSVSFVITFVLVNEASSATVAVSETATGAVFEVWAFNQSMMLVVDVVKLTSVLSIKTGVVDSGFLRPI